MSNVVKNSKMSSKKSVTAKQLAKSNLTKRKNPDWDNLDRGYRYLTLDMKLPHDLAVAVMGNVVEESLGDYKAALKNGGGRGLIQWDGRKAPNGRYSLWGSIWASVAKPANVYDSTTDTVKNYWAPWGGLKGDKVRLKFIKAPLKEKARIYAESYLRPGKPRIADRQLSAMQLDSIYNPRIKDVIVLKDGGQIRKMQTGGGTSSLLNWNAEDWLSKRVPKPDGTKYSLKDIKIFNSHVPEYQLIEKESKANGTWLKMLDGSTWKGDPRAWVMMQSSAYKKNYSSTPWYTGQAAWPTTYDYGNGTVETNKLTRAPYYNGQMWFSNSKDYGDIFAHVIDSKGIRTRSRIENERNIKGHNFLSAIPKLGNYRHLEAPPEGTYDHWEGLPYIKTSNGIERVLKNNEEFLDRDNQNVYFPNAKEGDWETSYKTDNVVNWSKDLGDEGIFMNKIYDGPTKAGKDDEGNWYMLGLPSIEDAVNEFISLPGFTNKVKFIEGNNGDFDINNPYKYAYNFNKLNNNRNLYAKQGGKMNILEFLKNGSEIHIKEENKGKFTSYCGGKVTDECILKGKNSSNPAIRKRATFADNARHFKHRLGGSIVEAFKLRRLILNSLNNMIND